VKFSILGALEKYLLMCFGIFLFLVLTKHDIRISLNVVFVNVFVLKNE
jgi:hypothetical protein